MEKKLFDLFTSKGKDLYLVGGIVRDRILGISSNDLDFATNALPNESQEILEGAGYKVYTIGAAFGTVSIIDNDCKLEITTYRKNEKYIRDNRRPVVEWGKTIEDDLIRRDFTFNAMAIDRNDALIDPFNGRYSLDNKVIETPMDAEAIFNDDPLRILRAVRFRSRFGFSYSEGVKKALASQAYRLMYLPKERVLDELNKILLGDYIKEALNDLLEYKLLNYVIPELTVLKDLKQESKFHHKDAWEHTVGVVANTPADLTLRWAALLHDLGKPYTFTFENSTVHFYRHEDVSAMLARSVVERLGLPRKMIEDVVYLVREHMKSNLYGENWSDSAVRRFIRETDGYTDRLLTLSHADITSHNPITVAKHLDSLRDLRRRIEELKAYKEVKCPIGGDVIMKYFNLTTGPEVGRLKDIIMEALTNGELELGQEAEVYLKYLENKINGK
jgi:poly(A) polymerase